MRCEWNDMVGSHFKYEIDRIVSDAVHEIDSHFRLADPGNTEDAERVVKEAEKFLEDTNN